MFTNTKSNKFISVFLSIVLVVTLIPTIAFADTDGQSEGSETTEQNTQSDVTSENNASDSSVSNLDVQIKNSEATTNSLNDNQESDDSENEKTSSEESQTNSNEANDQANSWRFQNGERIYSYEGATTETVDPYAPMPLAAVSGASSYATWYKSNGTTSYTYKADPDDVGQNIAISGVKRVGIDVSYWQGNIDWTKVKNSGISFAIIRCGYGSDFTSQDDKQFLNNVRGAQANGIDIGIYLYSHATKTTGNDSSASSEAKHVLRLLNEAGLEPSDLAYPVFYDLEDEDVYNLSASQKGQIATTFCNAISAAGYEVGIYSNLNWWSKYLTDPAFDNPNWHKWVARYPGPNKATSSGVSDTEIWQFSDCGNVDGISGNVDMNFDYVYRYGWRQESGKWYWYDEEGNKATGWKLLEGIWYFFNTSGAMETDWEFIDGKWYYLYPSWGGMATGWINLGGTYYYLDKDGAMLTGWQEYNGNTYYLDSSGAMATGWKEIEDEWYYFANWGGMETGWINPGGTWYYLNSDGVMLTGFQTINNELYYLSETGDYRGSMWSNCQINLGNNICGYASSWGAIFKLGIYDGNKIILQNNNGETLTGWQYIANRWFYGQPGTGIMQTGWLKLGSTWYYLSSTGAMVTGWQTIDGKSYYFTSSGVWVDGGEMAIRAQGYSSGTSYLIMVDCAAHKVGVFKGSVNNWSLQYSWSCVTGAPSTPTIKGVFHTTGFKRNALTTDSRAIYCTQIWGGYFFHSILANENELGKSLSHGCIRLPYSAAQWIHRNIFAGTTVVIYN